MLNMISNPETAAELCAGSALGAFLPQGVGTVMVGGTGAGSVARPRAVWTPDGSGQCRDAAGQDPAIGRGQPLGLQNPSKQYPHSTRIAAASGGGLGPHSARDPV